MKEKIVKENLKRENKGITLIALIITIVVLIILAGVAINLTIGNNGIFTKAKQAREDYKVAANEEQTILDTTKNILDGLEIGTEVTYIPSGTYIWQAKYATSDLEDKEENNLRLSSEEGGKYRITKWKIVDVSTKTGKVTLIASNPTEGKVRLQGAQGYNNGVKLLNDACSNLYGDSLKGIIARSINIVDIEEKMDYDPTTFKVDGLGLYYGQIIKDAYTVERSKYPIIYKQEMDSTIDGKNNAEGLKMSEQIDLIERKSDEGNIMGAITITSGINPKQTNYYLKYNELIENMQQQYKKILLPKQTNTNYNIASRCVNVASSFCDFGISVMSNGGIAYKCEISSPGWTNGGVEKEIFPVIVVNASQIIKSNDNEWYIK